MKLDKAIELLEIATKGWPVSNSDSEDYYKALELGIEALKHLAYLDSRLPPETRPLLPGETKE